MLLHFLHITSKYFGNISYIFFTKSSKNVPKVLPYFFTKNHWQLYFRQGCCEIPVCPDGQTAVQPCNDDQRCPVGLQCIENACCRPQLTTAAYASTVVPPSLPEPYLYPWLTSSYATTPVPYYQLQQTTYVPVGPQKPFPRTSSCNSCCPRYQIALCMCSQVQNLCPQQTSCNQGACCAASMTCWDLHNILEFFSYNWKHRVFLRGIMQSIYSQFKDFLLSFW